MRKGFQQILTLFPNDFSTGENLGYILLKKKEYQNAFRAYKKALKLEKDGIIYEELAYLYYLKENYNKALESCNFALRHDPDLKFSLKRLSCYYHKKGILMRSIISYVRKFIKNPIIRFHVYFNLKILKLHIRGYLSNEL